MTKPEYEMLLQMVLALLEKCKTIEEAEEAVIKLLARS